MTLIVDPPRVPLTTSSWAGTRLRRSLTWLDDAHRPTADPQPVEDVHHVVQRRFVEAAEAFVDEHGLHVEASRLGRDHVGDAERERERREEALASREAGRLPFGAGPRIDDPEAEPALAPTVALFVGVDDRVAIVRHAPQPLARRDRDLLEPRREHVGREPHPVRDLAVFARGEVGKRPDPLVVGRERNECVEPERDLGEPQLEAGDRVSGRVGGGRGIAPGLLGDRDGIGVDGEIDRSERAPPR